VNSNRVIKVLLGRTHSDGDSESLQRLVETPEHAIFANEYRCF
jgi:hypothetical protein